MQAFLVRLALPVLKGRQVTLALKVSRACKAFQVLVVRRAPRAAPESSEMQVRLVPLVPLVDKAPRESWVPMELLELLAQAAKPDFLALLALLAPRDKRVTSDWQALRHPPLPLPTSCAAMSILASLVLPTINRSAALASAAQQLNLAPTISASWTCPTTATLSRAT